MVEIDIKGSTLVVDVTGGPALAIFQGPEATEVELHGFVQALTEQEGYQPPRANFAAGFGQGEWWYGNEPVPEPPGLHWWAWNRIKAARAFVYDNVREWLRRHNYIRG